VAVSVQVVHFGEDAARALREVIAEAQSLDPLAPVTVVVPRGALGLATRRWLASGTLGQRDDGHPGVLNVRFVTGAQLADELGGAPLSAAGSLPATDAIVHAAVRAALAAAPGPVFGPAREHPATVRAMVAAYRDLRGASAETLRRLGAQSVRAAEVLRLVDEARPLLDGFYDEVDLFDEAVAVLGEGSARDTLGQLVWYLPVVLSPHEERLLEAFARVGSVPVLLGLTGDGAADESARALFDRLGGSAEPPTPTEPPTGTQVVSAPTADAEVLDAMRTVMGYNAEGVALERMALAYAGAPYPRLVSETLEQAGIPFNGAGTRSLSSTVAGRTLLGAFELADGGWARDAVLAWMAAAPIRDAGREIPTTVWDLISREAGVISGLDGWVTHLESYAISQRTRLSNPERFESDESADRHRERCRTNIEDSENLLAFVERLAGRFARTPESWSGWADWAADLLEDSLGGPTRIAAWPLQEAEALTAVREILQHLSVLDRIHRAPDAVTFRSALAVELEAPAPQTTRFGRGLLVGRVAEVIGLDLDVVFVLGMSDGAFPAPAREDPTLPDHERAAAGADLRLRAGRPADCQRDYLGALASAPRRILSYARADQNHGRAQRPSRWLLDTLGALTGSRRLYSGDLETLAETPVYRVLPSFSATVGAPGEPASVADRDLRSLLLFRSDTGTLEGHYLLATEPVLSSALRTRRERRGARFSRFDGHIDPALVNIPSPATGADQSPTGLEAYAQCPRRYFFGRLLRIRERPKPEAIVRISPLDRGSLVHAVLERFVALQTERPAAERIAPYTPWSGVDHDKLGAIAETVFAEYERAGLVGRPLLWELDRATITRELHTFLRNDDEHRRTRNAVPEAVELAFGRVEGAPVAIELAGGRRITFKGMADRVDRTEDGSLVVIDYKTGAQFGLKGLDDDPVIRGTKLQLPIYAMAAQSRFGKVPVDAWYWFVSDKGGFVQLGYEVTEERLGRFADVLRVVVDGIEAGVFPGRPGDETNVGYENCRRCDFDAICPTDRGRAWTRDRGATELADYVALAEPAPPGTA
jgi:RecB family exonuclease